MKTALSGYQILYDRLSQIAGTDQDHVVLLIQPQDLADLLIQIFRVIAISLLAKPSEIIKILSDLRGGHLHDPAQLLRGDPLLAGILQIP